MNKNERFNQIVSEMKAGTKKEYRRHGEVDEVKNELFLLQEEAVKLTFSDDHTEYGNLKIYDVYQHLEQLNRERGNIADQELEAFRTDSFQLSNSIRSIVSGNAGEQTAARSLKMLRCNNRLVRNVELQVEDYVGELDFVVFTERKIFLVEVKNARQNILIDREGNLIRVSPDGLRTTYDHDRNFGEKMNIKEFVLRKTLERYGYNDPQISSLIVFTNNGIQIDNQTESLRCCNLFNLLNIVQDTTAPVQYNDNDLNKMATCLKEAAKESCFPFPIDADSFKKHFASLMVKLEGYDEPEQKDDGAITGCDVQTTPVPSENTEEKTMKEDETAKEEPQHRTSGKTNGKTRATYLFLGMALAIGSALCLSRQTTAAHRKR